MKAIEARAEAQERALRFEDEAVRRVGYALAKDIGELIDALVEARAELNLKGAPHTLAMMTREARQRELELGL